MASAAKSRITDVTVRALVEARHDDPSPCWARTRRGRGGDPRPGAGRRRSRCSRRPPVPWSASWHGATGRPLRGPARGSAGLVRLHPARPQCRRHLGRPRPLSLSAGARRARRLPDARGHAPAAVGAAGRACDRACRRRRACISPSGRPTPPGSPWSATSTAGTAGATRCAAAAASGSGRSSSRAWRGRRSTNTSCAAPMARCCR